MMQRIKWIDNAKGFAMLCVVLGHAITGPIRENNDILGLMYNFIYLFHMPLFFFLSGYLYQCNEHKYLVGKISKLIYAKAQYLMIPYFSYSIITYVVISCCNQLPILGNILRSGGYEIDSIGKSIFQILFWQGSLDQHLWFIYCLFLIYIFNIVFLRGNSKNRKCIYIAIALIFYIALLKTEINILQRFSNYLIFFVIGRCSYKNKDYVSENVTKEKWRLLVSFFSTIILTIIRLLTINIIFDSYLLTTIKSVYSLLTSISLVCFICLLFQCSIRCPLEKTFSKIYKYNFEIYILHQPFIISGCVMLLTRFCGEGPLLDIGIVMAVTVIGILVCIAITRIVRCSRIAGKLLFGK